MINLFYYLKDIFGHFSLIRAFAMMMNRYKLLQKQLSISVKSLLLDPWSNTYPFCVLSFWFIIFLSLFPINFSSQVEPKKVTHFRYSALHLLWRNGVAYYTLFCFWVFYSFLLWSVYFYYLLTYIFHFFLFVKWVSVVYYVAWLIHMHRFFWKRGKNMLIVWALATSDYLILYLFW